MGKNGCVRTKMAVFGKKWFYSGKVVVFGQGGCIWVKMVAFGQKLLYSGKSGFIRANWLYSVKSGGNLAKAVVFAQGVCIWAKWLY